MLEVTIEQLEADPHPLLARLREDGAGGVGSGARRLARHAARPCPRGDARLRGRSRWTIRASPPGRWWGGACSRRTATSTLATAPRSRGRSGWTRCASASPAAVEAETERLIDALEPAGGPSCAAGWRAAGRARSSPRARARGRRRRAMLGWYDAIVDAGDGGHAGRPHRGGPRAPARRDRRSRSSATRRVAPACRPAPAL